MPKCVTSTIWPQESGGKGKYKKPRIIILKKYSYHDMMSSISTDKLPILRFNRDFNLKGPFCKNQLKTPPQGGSISPNVVFFFVVVLVVLNDNFKLIFSFLFKFPTLCFGYQNKDDEFWMLTLAWVMLMSCMVSCLKLHWLTAPSGVVMC